jgi:tetratricopeptide (TPR) repeat protein
MGLLLLAGCGHVPTESRPPWRDQAFQYDASLVTVDKEALFRLDPELLRQLQSPTFKRQPSQQRLQALLTLIFGPERKDFRYAIHSTPAAETWQARRGDCLSLTILTYAAARAANLVAQMQEVEVPPQYDRRGGYDHVGRHVNLLLRVPQGVPAEDPLRVRDVVIDFEPVLQLRGRKGVPLTDDAILARYYNNRGVEYLDAGDRNAAYAHFRAAIEADRTFAAGYGNLAVLYRSAGLVLDTEALLRQALQLGDEPGAALYSLHELLREQGRSAEARDVATRLEAKRESEPYYWIGLGLRYLEEGEAGRAAAALERARDMTSGFGEVHRYLALAYWRLGKSAKAHEELALLSSLDGDAGVAKLRSKFKASVPQ